MLKDELDKHIRFDNNNNEDENIGDQWIIKNRIHNADEKILGYRKRVPKKEWMTEILNMMEERRLAKRNMQKYNQIHQNICEKIREDSWLARQHREAEELLRCLPFP